MESDAQQLYRIGVCKRLGYDARRQELRGITSLFTYYAPELGMQPKQTLTIAHCIKQVEGLVGIFSLTSFSHIFSALAKDPGVAPGHGGGSFSFTQFLKSSCIPVADLVTSFAFGFEI